MAPLGSKGQNRSRKTKVEKDFLNEEAEYLFKTCTTSFIFSMSKLFLFNYKQRNFKLKGV